MIHTVFHLPNGLKWIDVSAPTTEELRRVGEEHGMHSTSLRDCIDPKHLPKFEKLGNKQFIILRHLDERTLSRLENDTVEELTRKISILIDEKCLITIHRKDTALLQRLREHWGGPEGKSTQSLLPIVLDLFRSVILSYEPALNDADTAFESFEVRIFNSLAQDFILEEMYFLKRRVSVYRRVLHQTLGIIVRVFDPAAPSSPFFHDLKEETERLHAWAETITEDVSTLLHTHISLASHRTNEIMRLLTIFSVFFMPLTFIVGVYGMNFTHMPELHSTWGYPAVWALMVSVVGALYFWFRRRGWLK